MSVVVSGVLSVAEFASETAAEEVALSLDATELVSEVALETLSDVVDVAETADEFAVVVEVEFCSCFEQAVRDNVTATAQSNAVSLFFINTILSLRQYRTEIVRILRRQIFRQIVQIERRRADARQAKFVQDDGKYASKMRTKP